MQRTLAAAFVGAVLSGFGLAVVAPPVATPFDVEEDCKPEQRKRAADALLSPWNATYAGRVHEVFAGLKGPALLTVGDGSNNPLFFNFMAHVNRTAMEHTLDFTVVNVALDPTGFKACEALQEKLSAGQKRGFLRRLFRGPARGSATLRCVSLHGWLPGELFQRGEAAGVRGTGTCPYNLIIWTKPHILKVAVNASSHGVLLIDTDVVIRQDIVNESVGRLATRRGASIVTGIENNRSLKINTGTVYIQKTGSMAMTILDEWIAQNSNYLNDDHGDQAALQAVFNINHRLWQYAVTYGHSVGQCSRPAPVATHYNCYANKLAPMKSQGDWDLTAQGTREQLGLFKEGDFASESQWLQRKVEAMESGGDWLVPAALDERKLHPV